MKPESHIRKPRTLNPDYLDVKIYQNIPGEILKLSYDCLKSKYKNDIMENRNPYVVKPARVTSILLVECTFSSLL
jgi:hypothetical protein